MEFCFTMAYISLLRNVLVPSTTVTLLLQLLIKAFEVLGVCDLEDKINSAVFPSLQGGPHNNHIAALAIALKQVASPEYKAYMQQVKKNAQALAFALLRKKCRLVTGGTDNHLLLWDLRPLGLTGCELCHITVNKVAIFGDNGAITPGGVKIGTPAMTSRGCLESDFETMADFLLRAAHIAIMV
ncbi:hypothetical protein Pint_33117 [Pistacia integerrima]|uniref:Uncharacterized protein n=1 Tax=Pistacia integerrima TaxID=434235 RepID=A0ACC0X3T0_9ROSI|nr:hypothetical protein Pint_33117 [Pistacia integerrima]